MPVTPLINGTSYAWANVSLVLFGVPVVGIVKINYEQEQKKENHYGAGIYPVSRGYGNVEPKSGSIELYLEEWKAIIAASPGLDPLQIAPFDIPVTFGGSRVLSKTDVLRGAEFTKDPLATSQGDTKILVTVPIIFALLEHKN